MRSKCGLTLIEMILVVAILGILMLAILPFMGTISRIWQYGDAQTEMLQQGRVAADKLNRELKNAIEVVSIDTLVDTSGLSDSNYIEIVNHKYEHVIFFHNIPEVTEYHDTNMDDNDLVMRTYNAAGNPVHSVLARGVNDVTFEYLGEDMTPLNLSSAATRAYHTCAVNMNLSFLDTTGSQPSSLPISTLALFSAVSKENEGGTWVIEYSSGDLVLVSVAGIERMRKTSMFNFPKCAAYNPYDKCLWGRDYQPGVGPRISKVDSDGNVVGSENINGLTNMGQELAPDPNNGFCWVASSTNLYRLDANCNVVAPFPLMVTTSELYIGVSVDSTDSSCWVAVYRSGAGDILKVRPDGSIPAANRYTQAKSPFAVSANPIDNTCWVAERDGGTGHKFRLVGFSGGTLSSLGTRGGYNNPGPMTSLADGSCWGISKNSGWVVKLSYSGGSILEEKKVTGFNMPMGVSVDNRDNSLWVADTNNNRLKKVSSDGTVLINLTGYTKPQFVATIYDYGN